MENVANVFILFMHRVKSLSCGNSVADTAEIVLLHGFTVLSNFAF